MTNSEMTSRGGFLEGLSSLFRGAAPETKAQDQSTDKSKLRDLSKDIDSAVESLKASIQKQREERERKASAGGATITSTAKRSGPSSVELQQTELKSAIENMRTSIVELHTKLGTGMTAQTIGELDTFMDDLEKHLQGEDLDARIRRAIAERLNQELSPISWKVLFHFMERAGITWPEPGGMLPGVTPEERAKAVQYQIAQAEDLFLKQNFEKGIENMKGIVTAWKRYPEMSSWLWKEVAIRGVAAGIRSNLLMTAVTKLRSEGPALRAKASELLGEHMQRIQAILQNGARSLEDAESVVRGTDGIVNKLLPELAWDKVSTLIDQEVAKFVTAK